MSRTDEHTADPTLSALEHACRSAIGDRLRTVTLHAPDGETRVYRRDDLDSGTDAAVHAEATAETGAVADGGHSTWSFAEGYVTRVRVGDTGVVVTSDGLKMDRADEVSAVVRGILSTRGR